MTQPDRHQFTITCLRLPSLACALAAIAIAPARAQTTYGETVLHSFTSPQRGVYPYGGVIRDSAGTLYGTTAGGGSSAVGVVYKLDTAGQETVLYTFTGEQTGRSRALV